MNIILNFAKDYYFIFNILSVMFVFAIIGYKAEQKQKELLAEKEELELLKSNEKIIEQIPQNKSLDGSFGPKPIQPVKKSDVDKNIDYLEDGSQTSKIDNVNKEGSNLDNQSVNVNVMVKDKKTTEINDNASTNNKDNTPLEEVIDITPRKLEKLRKTKKSELEDESKIKFENVNIESIQEKD